MDHPGRMELDELHVHEAATRVECEAQAVAIVLVAARRAPSPEAGVATRRQDDRIGQVDRPLAGVEVEGEGAEAGAIGHEQPRDVLVLLDADAELASPARHGALDRAAGEVARVAGASPSVCAEEALVELAVRRASELAAPVGELANDGRRLAGHDLDHPRIPEEVALAPGIGEVLLPRVLRVPRPERGVDAAGREHGVRVELRALAEHHRLGARLRRGDRGAPSGGAGADHQDVGGLAFDACAKATPRAGLPHSGGHADLSTAPVRVANGVAIGPTED